MHKVETLWENGFRVAKDTLKIIQNRSAGIYWNDVSVLAESCHSDQMIQSAWQSGRLKTP
jgi:hypothetical protein